ncbi:MAG: insulinase family protein [Synechococcales cyanobacterium CRU_2_2]|nr:insulinase family protein [Synechococcales cyanobacterium CRU_2_2]
MSFSKLSAPWVTRWSHRVRKLSLGLGLSLILLSLQFLLSHQPSNAAPQSYSELEFPPLPEIQLPEYQRLVLDNGLVVYLMEDHDLPLVDGTAFLRTGGRFESTAQTGLASLTGSLMRAGGTKTELPAQLNQFLEDRAASIETSISQTAAQASFSALTEDLEPVVRRFAQILRQPAFDPAQVDLALSRTRGNLARRNDDPGDIADREFDKVLYGTTSPYGRTVETETLEQINREEMMRFYQENFFPNRMILGIYGDFDSAQMTQLVQATLGDWKPTLKPLPPLPEVTQAQANQVFVVDQPQVNQSDVRLGHLGGLLSDRDYPALSVLNDVMNGFGGRLSNEIRSRQGLAYSVYAYWSPSYDFPGTFVAGAQTRTETTAQLIEGIRQQIKTVQETPISPEELELAKQSTLNSFVFNFQDPSQTLSRLMRYEYYGYPSDFIFQYQKAVAATTIADVQRVAQTYLKPEKFVTLVVGNVAAFEPSLKALNPDRPLERIAL